MGENFTKDFPVKNISWRFLCKMSSAQNYRQFFCKIFCWWSPMWNSFFMGTKFNFKYLWWATSRSPDRPPVKRFSDYVETWPTSSSWYTNVRYFWVLVKQLFNGNEIQFQILKFGKSLQRISLQFFFALEVYVKWIQIRIIGNSFVKFSVGGPRCETTFLWERNSNINFLSEVPL